MATLGPRALRHVLECAHRTEREEVSPLQIRGEDDAVWACAVPHAVECGSVWPYRDAEGAREAAARLAAACSPDLRDVLARNLDLLAGLALGDGVCGVRLEADGQVKAMMCGPHGPSSSAHVVVSEERLRLQLGWTRATAERVGADLGERAFPWVLAAMAVGAAWALSAA